MAKKKFEHNKRNSIIFIATTAALQVLLSLLAYVVYETWVAAFGPGWLGILIALELFSITFLTATLLAYSQRSWIVRSYYRFAAYWFACTGPLFGSSVLFALLEQIPQISTTIPPETLGLISFGIGIAVILYGIWQSGRAQIITIQTSLPNLPSNWKRKTIAFVSDLHLGDVRGRHFAKKIARKINAINPDMVLVGGDVYDGIRSYADELIEPLKDIKAPHGVYFASGNHEYLRNSQEFLPSITKVNMKILDDEIIDVEGLQILGVDFEDTAHREDFEKVLHTIPVDRTKPSILIKHVPDNLDIAESYGISLLLAGHTHRGQLWPLSYITKYLFKGYDYGLKPLGKMSVYTSSGVGTWGPPFRLGTKSEIVKIELI